jgi:hypothetical protein
MNLILETGQVILEAAPTTQRAHGPKRPSAFQCNRIQIDRETGEHCLKDLSGKEAEELLNWLLSKGCWGTEIDYEPRTGFIVRWQPPGCRPTA